MELPFDPAILLLELYPKYPETLLQENLCTPMFTAALFITAMCWEQPKCPSIHKWIEKLWYIYTTEYYTAERMKFYPLRQLEGITLSEISQVVKDKYTM